jgi:hypothetical protein
MRRSTAADHGTPAAVRPARLGAAWIRCALPSYEPVCDAVEVVRTAADLGTFAQRLLQFQGSAARVLQ